MCQFWRMCNGNRWLCVSSGACAMGIDGCVSSGACGMDVVGFGACLVEVDAEVSIVTHSGLCSWLCIGCELVTHLGGSTWLCIGCGSSVVGVVEYVSVVSHEGEECFPWRGGAL